MTTAINTGLSNGCRFARSYTHEPAWNAASVIVRCNSGLVARYTQMSRRSLIARRSAT